jgi:ribosome-binding protein aMBF1 (putative translation factor)
MGEGLQRAVAAARATRKQPKREATMAGSTERRAVPKSENKVDASKFAGRLALRIRALRTEHGWTVEKLAKLITKAGYPVSTSNLYAWENGTVEPQLNAFPALAKALKLPRCADLLPPE